MADKALTRVLAAAIVAVAAGALRADSLAEAARRAGIEPETAAAQGDQGLAIGSDARTGERVVAVFRRGPNGSWAIGRRWRLCAGQEAASPGGPPAIQDSAAPAAGPVAMPPPRELSDGFVRSIQDELRRRARQSDAGDGEKIQGNAAYLKDLVQDIGWIDIRRFGVPASCNAVRIVLKSGDRAFLAAALPKMERDLKNSDEGRECYEAAEQALAKMYEH
jgi:hypothetical protein